jgi:hypothetical protein
LFNLKLLKGSAGCRRLDDLENVEAHRLGERAALTDLDGVTDGDTEGGRDVGDNVLVTLLIALVLGEKVKVVTAEHNGALHVRLDDLATHDAATNRHAAGERALFVNKVAGLRRLWHFVAETDFLPVARRARRRARIVLLQADDGRSAKRSENAGLLLKGTLILFWWVSGEWREESKEKKKKKWFEKKKKKKSKEKKKKKKKNTS